MRNQPHAVLTFGQLIISACNRFEYIRICLSTRKDKRCVFTSLIKALLVGLTLTNQIGLFKRVSEGKKLYLELIKELIMWNISL